MGLRMKNKKNVIDVILNINTFIQSKPLISVWSVNKCTDHP